MGMIGSKFLSKFINLKTIDLQLSSVAHKHVCLIFFLFLVRVRQKFSGDCSH